MRRVILPRFVILEHDYPDQYWDFLLEAGDHLRAWKLRESPEKLTNGENIEAEIAPNHRLIYLDYEGPISNGRGAVKRFDQGLFKWLEENDGKVTVEISGKKVIGTFKLPA